MVGLQTLDLAIGVRVPASQPTRIKQLRAARNRVARFCVPIESSGRLKTTTHRTSLSPASTNKQLPHYRDIDPRHGGNVGQQL
jgi:hypothetical protein